MIMEGFAFQNRPMGVDLTQHVGCIFALPC